VQERFKAFPVQSHEHYLTVLRGAKSAAGEDGQAKPGLAVVQPETDGSQRP